MTQITTQSGRSATISMAPFKDAMALKNAISSELVGVNIELDSFEDFDVTTILPAILKIDSSPAVYAAMMTCLSRCLYNGVKITEATFEDADARGDYYELVIACAKENLSPFFRNLASRSSLLAAKFSYLAPTEKPQK